MGFKVSLARLLQHGLELTAVHRSPPENVEVIEMPRPEREGIFALPQAVGAGARKAARRLEDVRIDDRIKGTGERLRSQRLGRIGTRKDKPPRVKLSQRIGRRRHGGSSGESGQNSDSESIELRRTKTTDSKPESTLASPSMASRHRQSEEETYTDAEEGRVTHGVAEGAELPGQDVEEPRRRE